RGLWRSHGSAVGPPQLPASRSSSRPVRRVSPMPTVQDYFNAERQGGLLFVAMAVAGVSFAAYLWSTRNAFLAMAWPLVLLGVLQVTIRSTGAWRRTGQAAAT